MKRNGEGFLERLHLWLRELSLISLRREVKAILLVLLGAVMLTIPALKFQRLPELRLGEPAPFDVIATRDVVITDEEMSEREMLKRLRALESVYTEKPEAVIDMRDKLDTVLATLELMRRERESYSFIKRELPGLKLSRDEYELLESMGDDEWEVYKFKLQRYLEHLVRDYRWRPEDVYTNRVNELIRSRLSNVADLNEELMNLTVKLLAYVLEPNVKLDEETIKKRIAELRREVEPLKVKVEKGKVILHKGDIVTKFHMRILRALGYTESNPLKEISYKFLLALTLSTLLFTFVNMSSKLRNSNFSVERSAFLTYLILFIEMLLARALENLSPLMSPVAFSSILLVLLLSSVEGALISLSGVIYHVFILSGLTPQELFLLALESLAASAIATMITRRRDLIRYTLITALTLSLIALLILSPATGRNFLYSVLYLNGGLGLSLVLAMGMLPFLENYLSLASPIRLVELMNPLHPLLQRLYNEAPGTYNHSLMVANLAEQAARAIGADSLLCRVGAYYHDIGKLKRPEYFVENQLSGVNPHDNLNPRISAIYIISHTRDGVDLAKEYNLPSAVIDFIKTHHGTSLVYYFYYKAKSQGMNVTEAEFRYPGPKPFTKETAILMLADSIEASARTLSNYDVNTLRDLIEEVVKMKIDDGQLQNAPLTLSELEKIKEAFLRTLISYYHKRIRYPNQKTR